jgi:hypothetical protein
LALAWLECAVVKTLLSSWLECVAIKNVGLSMAGMCHGKKHPFQHGLNMLYSKKGYISISC